MARAATTADVFNAIAEPRRREIVDLLARGGAKAVGDLVALLGLAQPAVSKHLAVLRKVGLVTVARDGQRRVYELNAKKLKPVHDWAEQYRRCWDESLDRLDSYLNELQEKESQDGRHRTSRRR